MKTTRLLSCLVAVAVLTVGATSASAAMITGEIGLIGTFEATGGSGLGDATGLSFTGDGLVIIGSGDFAATVGDDATFNDFSFASLPVDPLYTTSSGLSFTLESLTIVLQTPTALDIIGTGTYSLAGFDDTQGTFQWTGDDLGVGVLTFSATGASPIPVPGAIWLFMSGLGVLAARRRVA